MRSGAERPASAGDTAGVVAAFARTSADRKPAPGMALAAAGALDLDLTASWVVGDSDCDVDLARAVGARPIRIGTGRPVRGRDAETVADLAAAVDLILAEHAALSVQSVPSAAAVAAFPAHKYDDAGCFAAEYSSELARAMGGVVTLDGLPAGMDQPVTITEVRLGRV